MTLKLVKPEPKIETQLHFSYSQLTNFLICPIKYAHQYVWGTQWESKGSSLVFGKAIHKAVEHFYRTLQETGGLLAVGELEDVFTQVFDAEIDSTETEILFKKNETPGSLKEMGLELLRIFHQETKPQRIMAVEFPFSVSIPNIFNGGGDHGVKLVGFFDLVEADGDGNYVIVELKTSAQRFSSLRLEYDLQSTVYSYAMNRMKLGTAEGSTLVRYDVLLKTKKPVFEQYFVTRSTADHDRLIHLINHVLLAIENRIFYRQTGWQCGDCQFKLACFARTDNQSKGGGNDV